MSYNITPILSSSFIGNSVSSINITYDNIELWTNDISFSAVNYFQPLVNFYNFYKDFWKATIGYATTIDAPNRLSSFKTTVQENSAKWIKPITVFYPNLVEYDASTISDYVDDAIVWFKQAFPIFDNSDVFTFDNFSQQSISGNPNFAEGTKAIIYFITYKLDTKADSVVTTVKDVNCSTDDRSARLGCQIVFRDNVTCYGRRVCPPFNGTYFNNFSILCRYENNLKTVTRGADFTIDREFVDRNENDDLGAVLMEVKNCEWQFVKFLSNLVIT
jgi:hypothetical protein